MAAIGAAAADVANTDYSAFTIGTILALAIEISVPIIFFAWLTPRLCCDKQLRHVFAQQQSEFGNRCGDELRRAFDSPPPVLLSFRNVRYSVPVSKSEDKEILKGINGYFKPGTLTAVMGPSGCGKSTLLDVLADQKEYGAIVGDIRVNGEHRTDLFRRVSAYVLQFDVLYAMLTPRETLFFVTELRMGNRVSTEEKYFRVLETLRALDLEHVADTRIGDGESGGLSGGQKRRVTVAIELVTGPSLILLDEPTSGLDAYGSLKLVSVLRKLADEGRTIACTIHQPRADIFNMFDNLLLLKFGVTMYFGSIKGILPYFEALGLAIDYSVNPADFIVDLTQDKTASEREEERAVIAKINAARERRRQENQSVATPPPKDTDHGTAAPGPSDEPAAGANPLGPSPTESGGAGRPGLDLSESKAPAATPPSTIPATHSAAARTSAAAFARAAAEDSVTVHAVETDDLPASVHAAGPDSEGKLTEEAVTGGSHDMQTSATDHDVARDGTGATASEEAVGHPQEDGHRSRDNTDVTVPAEIDLDSLCDRYATSALRQNHLRFLYNISKGASTSVPQTIAAALGSDASTKGGRYASSFLKQTFTLARRAIVNDMRNSAFVIGHWVIGPIMMLFYGALYSNIASPSNADPSSYLPVLNSMQACNLNDASLAQFDPATSIGQLEQCGKSINAEQQLAFVRASLIYQFMAAAYFSEGPYVSQVHFDKRMFFREHSARSYSSGAYHFAYFVRMFFAAFLKGLLFPPIGYFAADLKVNAESYFLFAIFFGAMSACGASMALLCSSAFPGLEIAQSVFVLINIIGQNLSGYWIVEPFIGWWFRWAYYINLFRYAFEGSIIAQQLPEIADDVQGYGPGWTYRQRVWVYALVIVLFAVALQFAAFFATTLANRTSSTALVPSGDEDNAEDVFGSDFETFWVEEQERVSTSRDRGLSSDQVPALRGLRREGLLDLYRETQKQSIRNIGSLRTNKINTQLASNGGVLVG